MGERVMQDHVSAVGVCGMGREWRQGVEDAPVPDLVELARTGDFEQRTPPLPPAPLPSICGDFTVIIVFSLHT